MKFIKSIFSAFGNISNFKALAIAVRPAYCHRIEPVTEGLYSSINSREKLQIIYANLRV